MSAEFLKEFLMMPPEYQDVIIKQQQELDELRLKLADYEKRNEHLRIEVLNRLPRWRKSLLHFVWSLYCKLQPKYS